MSLKEMEKPIASEHGRLEDARTQNIPWKKWGPYLSERRWGTVREDYSENGDAWNFFTHDHARSRAYRWGEDGLGGISDDQQQLCFALTLCNGKDRILKERLFFGPTTIERELRNYGGFNVGPPGFEPDGVLENRNRAWRQAGDQSKQMYADRGDLAAKPLTLRRSPEEDEDPQE